MYQIENLSFSFPNQKEVLKNISLEIKNGEFLVICGVSGCGKTTLLKHLKPSLTPAGQKSGNIRERPNQRLHHEARYCCTGE